MTFRLYFLFCLLALTIGASIAIFQYQQDTDTNTTFVQRLLDQNVIGATLLTPLAQKTIFAPPPLQKSSNQDGGNLSITGILNTTNQHRVKADLTTLTNNTVLNQAAANKVDDMFTQQYFEHVSPQNKGPANVVEEVKYEYLSVGENLALGNYADDADLVRAWMDSPGHRANILGSKFTEIGISAKQGMFEGKQTWLAVQTFALPASACPAPNTTLRSTFDIQQTALNKLQADLDAKKVSFDHRPEELKNLTDEIKTLAKQGNTKIKQGNEEIKIGNEYVATGASEEAQQHWDTGKQLQKEGNQLIKQAQQKESNLEIQRTALQNTQDLYNVTVNQFNELNNKQSETATQINQQIKNFNNCLKTD